VSGIGGTGNDDATGESSANVSSYSNDGVSVQFNTLSAHDVVTLSNREQSNIVRMYLSNVRNSLGQKILYRGLYPNE
jgi:hypothetical protein